MFLRTTTTALLLASLGLLAMTPGASASCLDTNPDDDGIGADGCNVPVLGECNVHALAYGQLPGFGGSCDGLVQCVRECGPPAASANGPALASCRVLDANPTDDNGVGADCTVAGALRCTASALWYGPGVPVGAPRCQTVFIYCVTEPCHYPLLP